MFRQAPSFPYHDLGIVEDGNTASRAISKDAYVIWKGESYFASTDILQGATLEENVNLTAIPDGVINGVVSALNNKLSYLDNVVTGVPVDISGYTTAENCYVCPSDGYARIAGNGHWLKIVNYSNVGEWFMESSSSNASSVYCKKGTKLIASGSSAKFFPLVSV